MCTVTCHVYSFVEYPEFSEEDNQFISSTIKQLPNTILGVILNSMKESKNKDGDTTLNTLDIESQVYDLVFRLIAEHTGDSNSYKFTYMYDSAKRHIRNLLDDLNS